VLALTDDKGRRVLVPADKLAYVEIAETEQRGSASAPSSAQLARRVTVWSQDVKPPPRAGTVAINAVTPTG
jgi:hypothetical protein